MGGFGNFNPSIGNLTKNASKLKGFNVANLKGLGQDKLKGFGKDKLKGFGKGALDKFGGKALDKFGESNLNSSGVDDSVIKTFFEHNIPLDKIEIADLEEGTHPRIPTKSEKITGVLGALYPVILINSYVFNVKEIMKMEIDTSNFLPTIQLKLLLQSGSFISSSMPKDGDIISIFINDETKIYKSIRSDFLITDATTLNANEDGMHATIILNGTLRVPKLYFLPNTAIKGTSFNVLQQIAHDLDLGFASNVEETDDEMIWHSGLNNYEEFIKDITDHSWKTPETFFNVFIDLYYNLNFVNVNAQFNNNYKFLNGLATQILNINQTDDEDKDNMNTEHPIVFTNYRPSVGSNFYFSEFKPISQSNSITKKLGYFYESVFFDHETLQNWDITLEPLITKGSEENSILLKGRAQEDYYLSQIKKQWFGIQYAGENQNVHDNYIIAKVQNMINNQEINKFNVKVSADRFNLNIYKYQRLPFVFFIQFDQMKKMQHNVGAELDTQTEVSHISVDRFYTGWYLLKGFKIIFDKSTNDYLNSFKHELIIAKRELNIPPIEKESSYGKPGNVPSGIAKKISLPKGLGKNIKVPKGFGKNVKLPGNLNKNLKLPSVLDKNINLPESLGKHIKFPKFP